MDTPSKEIMLKNGLFNRISKIYRSLNKNISFIAIQEAKDFFWTKEAQELFRYCCKEEYRLTDDKKGLHWTIAFGEPTNPIPSTIKWSDQWRDGKLELDKIHQWWNNKAVMEHNAKHLF